MSPQAWYDRLVELAGSHGKAGPATDPVGLLVELHEAMLAAPASIFQRFRQVSEEWLEPEGLRRADRICAGDFSWTPPQVRSSIPCLMELGSQIRALDEFLLRERSHDGPPDDPNVDWLSPEGKWFLVPRTLPREPRATGQGGTSYLRRGLLNHRLLPTDIAGHRVTLHWQDAPMPPDGPGPLGAALFEEFSLRISRSANGFLAEGVDCKDPVGTVAGQIEGALSEGCDCLVWPELTVPPDLLDEIARRLADRDIRDVRGAPRIVVAGSWHVEDGDTVSNVATVLDGFGRKRFSFAKFFPFSSRETGFEAIEPGHELPILVTDDRLVAFAVCRDFCERDVDPPFLELDVDLLVVPSMGRSNTMSEHLNVAKTVRVRYRCGTFIVQQLDEPVEGAGGAPPVLGYVLPAPDDPAFMHVTELTQTQTFRAYRR